MSVEKKCVFSVLCGALLLVLSACAAEVGSDKWCADMKNKSKADWSANDAINYAKYCILK